MNADDLPQLTPDFIQLTWIDWSIIVGYVVFALIVGLYFSRRAGKNLSEFFLTGRNLPWWIVGTSMVATTFSTDTPNLVTNWIRESGVWGYWKAWGLVIGNMVTVFFFARLWRRSQVMTDVEFYEIRYSGKSAAFLRGFRAVYLGFFFNVIVMAMVNLAAGKIGTVLFGWDPKIVVAVCCTVAVVYAAMAGLWGVIITDLVQFVMAMVGSVAAAIYVIQMPEIGGLSNLFAGLEAAGREENLRFLPDFSDPALLIEFMLLPLFVLWWASWYPGAEPGGGGYVAQRMFAAKDEKHSLLATLWFYTAHVALRPWPWIFMALASLLIFPVISQEAIGEMLPHLSEGEFRDDLGYSLMLRLLPPGLIGVLITALGAAYMSTLDTHLNWGSSYLVNDTYRRFLKPDATDAHYVLVSRGLTVVLIVFAALISFLFTDASTAFNIILSIGAGTGLIYILRWFWHRINAWTEISAMIAAPTTYALIHFVYPRFYEPLPFHVSFPVIVAVTTIVWLTTTLLTPPTEPEKLDEFYRRIRPAGPGWKAVRQRVGNLSSEDSLTWNFVGMLLGLAMIMSALFGIGNLAYLRPALGIPFCLISLLSLYLMLRYRRKFFYV